jgi:hypothetical protein
MVSPKMFVVWFFFFFAFTPAGCFMASFHMSGDANCVRRTFAMEK